MSIFDHLADKITTAPSICDAITLLSSIVVILCKDKIYLLLLIVLQEH